MSYREYFDIDPEYFPQVDKKIIEEQPDLWKKFYPHPTFIKLLKSMVDVLSRKQKLSVWVDGAYGTGKSHAVLTLKKLIEASDEETNAYFERYNLDNFLCQKLIAQKNEGKILVCHRYGSSDIQSDTVLVAIQEGVEKALADAGIENVASTSLKNSLIRYFEDEENKQSFDIYAKGKYQTVLNGDTADSILEKLRNFKEEALNTLVKKVFKVPVVKGSFSMTTGELCDWIREIIEKNNLKELVFIWDEFSEYFENNMHHLTGFQQVAELAATAPFCLLIVTHKAEGYFSDGDPDKRKILDRFVSPIHISLPENIAFELMHEALKVTDDVDKAAKWEKHRKSLEDRTMQSRSAVSKKIGLTDKDLSNVLQIHPYAALILQHISIYYTSTARSMFNFIKNDEGEDVKAFQWFIDRYDFSSQNPFVTIDMLWNFFYETGSQKLADGIREVLSCYTQKMDKELMEDLHRTFFYLNLNTRQSVLFFSDVYCDYQLVAKHLYDLLKQKYPGSFHLAVSSRFEGHEALPEIMAQLEQTMEEKFYHPDMHVFTNEGDENHPVSAETQDSRLMEKISEDISRKDVDQLKKHFECLVKKYENDTRFSAMYVKFVFSNVIQELFQENQFSEEYKLDHEVERLYSCTNLKQILAITQENIQKYEEFLERSMSGSRDEVASVKNYIYQHYAEDLSLETLAEKVYLSSGYLSFIFKKETGMNLNRFIRVVRMEKAKELLCSSNMKVAQVSEQVGIPNVSYFCRSFREYYGCSPESYRKGTGEEDESNGSNKM